MFLGQSVPERARSMPGMEGACPMPDPGTRNTNEELPPRTHGLYGHILCSLQWN